MQKIGIILDVDTPVMVTIVKQMLNTINGVKVRHVTKGTDKNLYVVDENEYQYKGKDRE